MSSSNKVVHVAVAVVEDSSGKFLLAKRPQSSHQGGLWEFPGGKIENDESVIDALKRELFEEVALELLHATPLIQIPHDYADKSVLLDVWKIEQFTGSAFGKEGQDICWVDANDFSLYEFPDANKSIICAIQLPDKYMITGEFVDENQLLSRISSSLKKNIKLVQFRAHHLPNDIYFDYAKKIHSLCQKYNAKLMLNCSAKNYVKYSASDFSAGIHLSVRELTIFSDISLANNILVSASTHNQQELTLAQERQVDFCVLSPVKKTRTHPDSTPLSWEKFKSLCRIATVPVYALGGIVNDDLEQSKKMGGQGISAIGAFWHV